MNSLLTNNLENKKYYIILLKLKDKGIQKLAKIFSAKKINKAMTYNSQFNEKFLSVDEIRKLIKKYINSKFNPI